MSELVATEDLKYIYPLKKDEVDDIHDAVKIMEASRNSSLPREKKNMLEDRARSKIREAVSGTHQRA